VNTPGLAVVMLLASFLCGDRTGAAPRNHGGPMNDAGSGRGWLGVSIQDMTPALARSMNVKTETGALIGEVTDDSPAERAGLKDEDIVVAFDGKAVENADGLRAAVRSTAPGSQVTMEVARKDERTSIDVQIGKAPRSLAALLPPIPPIPHHLFQFKTSGSSGLTLRTLGEQLGAYFQAPGGRGVLVEEVEDESDASRAGFQAGDVITRAGTKSVEEVRDVRRAIRGASEGQPVVFQVLRRGSSQTLSLTIQKDRHARVYRFRKDHGLNGWWFDNFNGTDLEKLELELEHLQDLEEN
jgi:serine protease Do